MQHHLLKRKDSENGLQRVVNFKWYYDENHISPIAAILKHNKWPV